MKELFEYMRRLLSDGEACVLCAIIESFGSTPRGPGSLMLASQDGRVWGSIGGAEAEYLALENAKTLLAQRGSSSVQNYTLPSSVCGGGITVFSQCFDPELPGLRDFVEKGIGCFSDSECTWLLMEVADNASGSSPSFALAHAGGIIALIGTQPENAAALLTGRPGCQKQEADKMGGTLDANGRLWFSLPLTQAGFVYVFGGGHVAQELVPLLSRLEFRCVVFDDRADYARQELFPYALKTIQGDFSRISDSLALTAADYAVIATRGHSWDLQAQSFAIRSSAAYIGVIGSKAKHEYIETQLLAAGFTPEQIHAPRVHAPIGIAIGSKTPAEVAVSIAAELIGVRSSTGGRQ